MTAPATSHSGARGNLAALADRFVACFPALNAEGRRIFVALYRQLALGEPVLPQQIALRAGVDLQGFQPAPVDGGKSAGLE